CSEGHDATAWNTTIVSPSMHGLAGNPQYEAIECITAPKQGRSGGGLYTSDGYIAGVCDFAEPRGNHGLYATPTSIYSILDRTASTSRNWSASHPRAERTDLKLDPESDSDRFGSMPPEPDPQDEEPAPRPNPRTSGGKWRPAGSPLPSLSTDR